jgi:hypothetical protein
MPTIRRSSTVFTACIVGFILAGCASAVPASPTASPIPTSTQRPTATATATAIPTFTPVPTVVAYAGTPASDGDMEVTLVRGLRRSKVILNYMEYWPKQGYMFIDVGLQVRNLNPGSPVQFSPNDLLLIDARGTSSQPIWGGWQETNAYLKSPFDVSARLLDPSMVMTVKALAYARLIYVLNEQIPEESLRLQYRGLPDIVIIYGDSGL